MKDGLPYQAQLLTPFGVLGIRCIENALTGIDFLAPDTLPQAAASQFAQRVCEQLRSYIFDTR